jgi:putative phage-type endonuclease
MAQPLTRDNYVSVIKKAVGRKKFRCSTREAVYDAIKSELEQNHQIEPNPFILNNILDQICQQIIEVNLSKEIKWIPDFNTVEERDAFYDKLTETIQVPEEYEARWQQYNFLLNIPQPAQRTPEWFEMRNNMITASSSAQAIGESKYDKPDKLILEKIGFGDKFKENKFVHHGKKYEKIATMIYEHMYNVKVGEFGLIPHPTISFLGASPDGIAMNTTLAGDFSPMVGRMLEIKCPMSRTILTEGKEDGEICPHYYWTQVQQQLECCDLEECDFWQCNIKECDYEEWEQEVETVHTEGQNQGMEVDKRVTKGIILQLLPKNHKLERYEKMEWYGKYIYPYTLTFQTDKQYYEWVEHMTINWAYFYRDLEKDYYLDKPLYWRLESSHNYLIKRDRDWFANTLPKLKAFWDRVLLYRENEEERNKFLESKKKPVAVAEVVDLFDD